jgi:hypothetical protein
MLSRIFKFWSALFKSGKKNTPTFQISVLGKNTRAEPILAPKWRVAGRSKQKYQLIAEKCFASHRMGNEQMFFIFSVTVA